MRTIEQVQVEIKNLELTISKLKSKIDGFEYSLTDAEFDEYLDKGGEQHTSVGSFYPSDILKSCDPILYRCAKSNYEGNFDLDDCTDYECNFDLDDCTEYTDMVGELESLESDLQSLQDELDSLESEAE